MTDAAYLLIGYALGILTRIWFERREHKRLHPQDWSKHAR